MSFFLAHALVKSVVMMNVLDSAEVSTIIIL